MDCEEILAAECAAQPFEGVRMRTLVALAVSLLPAFAMSQNVANVGQVASRATISMMDGAYRSCGLRFVGLDVDTRALRFPVYGFDFNLVVSRHQPAQMAALLKTEITKSTSLEHLTKASGQLSKVKSTWVNVEGTAPFKIAKAGIPGENGLSSLTVYDEMTGVFRALADAASAAEKPVFLLGVELAEEKATRIYRFRADVKEEDAQAYLACANALVELWNEDAKR